VNPSLLPSPELSVPILISSSVLVGGGTVERKGGGYSNIPLDVVAGGAWAVGGRTLPEKS